MSRYGSVNITSEASLVTRIVQCADAEGLAVQTNAALSTLPAGYVVIGLTLAGSGKGATFTVTIEAAAIADASGGFLQAPPTVTCYLAADADELSVQHRAALPLSGVVADSQTAGANDGTRFMGMLVQGVVTATGGGYSGLGGSKVGIHTVGPNSSEEIAFVGIQSNKPTGILVTFYASFDVSTPSGAASFNVELLIDGNPVPDPLVAYSGFTPVNPGDPVVYTTTLSFQQVIEVPDALSHFYTLSLTTGPNTTVATGTVTQGTLDLLGNLENFS